MNIISKATFSYVSSSGAGGQNVNRRATKAILRIQLSDLELNDSELERLIRLAGSRITKENSLLISSQTQRTQARNKNQAISKLVALIQKASFIPKKRKATKPGTGANERRLEEKKKQAAKKIARITLD
jgi:ribosome-associated protein